MATSDRIVGGQKAPKVIPWQVSVQMNGNHFCGGTILSNLTVLSAAHCFYQAPASIKWTIRAGSRKKSSGGQVWLKLSILNSH